MLLVGFIYAGEGASSTRRREKSDVSVDGVETTGRSTVGQTCVISDVGLKDALPLDEGATRGPCLRPWLRDNISLEQDR